jgi:DNA-binding GntR family transcriptional regulator
VSPLTAADMTELFMIVGALEGLAARLAADLPDNVRLPLAREMRRLNQGLRAASRKRPPDIAAAKDLHVQFHRATVTAAGPRLRTKLDALHSQWERYERAYTSVIVHEFAPSLREHDAIVEAIQAADAEAAERAVIRNYRHGTERCQRVVALIGERGAW